jgi:DNA topoisomerase-1
MDTTLHVGDGSHNCGTDFRTVLAHEVGHLVMPHFEDAIREKFRIVYDSQPKEYWEQHVSIYAGQDDHELFGEAFSAWTHPDYKPGMLPSILEEVMRGVSMMKLDANPALFKIPKTQSQQDDEDDSDAPQRQVTITTAEGTLFTTSDIDAILNVVGDADWFIVQGVISPALKEAFEKAGRSELVTAGAGTDTHMFDVAVKGAEDYASAHSADLVTGLTDTTRDMLRGTIEDAVKEGWGPAELREELENSYAFSPQRAKLIGDNEIALAYSRGRITASREAGATKKVWLLSADHDDMEDCSCSDAADAGQVNFEDSFVEGDDDYYWSPGHVNCVFSGNSFAPYGRPHQLVRAKYSGPAITIKASGSDQKAHALLGNSEFHDGITRREAFLESLPDSANLSVGNSIGAASNVVPAKVFTNQITIGPKHPVLTRRGFVEAQFLREGDELLYDKRIEADVALKFDIGKIPLIEDAFSACLSHVARDGSVAAAANYFHGDEEFINDKIDVVRPARYLLPVFDVAGIEQLGKCSLIGADMSAAHVASCRACQLFLEGVFSACGGNVGGTSELFSVCQGGINISTALPGTDSVTSGMRGSSELQALSARFGGPIPFQTLTVTFTQATHYEGYCYDASTEGGLYAANGLLVKNCHCDTAAIYPGEEDDDEEDDEDDAEKLAKYISTLTAEFGKLSKQWVDAPDEYEEVPLDEKDYADDQEVLSLADAALKLGCPSDYAGMRVAGRAHSMTMQAASDHQTDPDRLVDHRRAYTTHMEAAEYYSTHDLNPNGDEAAAAHEACADKHYEILTQLQGNPLFAKYSPDQPREPDGKFGEGDNDNNDGSGMLTTKTGLRVAVTYKNGMYFGHVDGKNVATVSITDDAHHVVSVTVDPDYQKKGIASAMYDHIERHIGHALAPSPTHQSPSGQALWASRAKKFAKYSPDQPRDPDGKFGDGDGGSSKQTDTKEFKAWFGKSKVVDKVGEPLVAYHGTSHDFSEFQGGTDDSSRGLGTWFVANAEDGSQELTTRAAAHFSYDEEDLNGGNSAIYPVYLSIQKPKAYSSYDKLSAAMDKAGGAAQLRESLQSKKFDGIVIRNSDTDSGELRDDWVAFSPTQIKSAVGNNGKFDPKEKDIAKYSPDQPRSGDGKWEMGDGVTKHGEMFGSNNDIQREIYTHEDSPHDGLRILRYPDGRRFVQTIELPPKLRGKGIAKKLYVAALKDGDLEIVPHSEDAQHVHDSLIRSGAAHIREENGKRYLSAGSKKFAKYSPDQPRDDHGRWTTGGEGTEFVHDGKQWTGGTAADRARLKALRVPPAWKNVRLNVDPHADKQVTGTDKKGRTQSLYTSEYRARQDAAKFERLKDFNKVLPHAVDKMRADMLNKSLDAKTRDSAAATYLISQTGIRIGSNKETGAEKQAYGASTLQGRHVKIDGEWMTLSFVGKKGVAQRIKLQDKDLANYIKEKAADRRENIFAESSDANIRKYFHSIVGDQFEVKDMRTWTGTATALRVLSGLKPPKNEAAYKKGVKAVAKTVSDKLGNTPAMALKAYIDPTVFKSWAKDFRMAA